MLLNKTRLALLVAILSAAAGAVVFKTPSVLFLLATLLAAPLLAGAMGAKMSRGLRVARQMPPVASVGDELRARLTVRNLGPLPALLVHAQGRGVEPVASAPWRRAKTLAAPAATASIAEQNACFETVGEAELVVPILMPGASFTGEIAWKLRRRGLYAWPGARAGTVDPIALSDALSARSAPAQLLVLPRPFKLRRLPQSESPSGARPLRRATASADGAQIHGVRPYQPGEGGRRIHWRATARTGQLHVIEWEEETASDLTILLDAHAACVVGPAGEDSLEMAITAAASVAAFLLEQGQLVRIFWWADDAATAPGNARNAAPNASGNAARLMSVEARHRAALTRVLSALAQIAVCHHENATLAALSARVAREFGDQNALLLSSDLAAWNQALVPWQSERGFIGARGLAFDAASFADAKNAHFTWRAGRRVTATMRRVETSETSQSPLLPAPVRRVRRDDSLVDALEKEV